MVFKTKILIFKAKIMDILKLTFSVRNDQSMYFIFCFCFLSYEKEPLNTFIPYIFVFRYYFEYFGLFDRLSMVYKSLPILWNNFLITL